ncbi:MAG: hypothetical protein NTW66_01375 [Candidatus Magasanikbacteria bacterium]|nr:hypothetical protein [Candidatus Magasanikbacteria bacterium]
MNERSQGFTPDSATNEAPKEIPEKADIHQEATAEEMAYLECFLKDHPEKIAAIETRRDCEQEKHELQMLLQNFEEAHSLEELNAIPDVTPELYNLFAHDRDMSAEQIESALANLSPEDAKRYQTRSPAIKDLKPIVALMNKMEKETNISQAEFDKLRTAYKVLSRAVGMINNNKVDHTR